CTEGRGAYW
nr:immunoglobulin heavy chain junction region [Mus musculus]